ncbi:TfoX/Sxy family protein [Celeribacter sp. PS-C1]|uniref:TfoX/Sxy family protein n=1 Tax=Celeribacter sp. PS-C1 TaxID=2820813 RepID=UPI001C664A51|nr:TfoX/Sxy family protein [Celeribacter sp. PS-C1]MBW6417323.1 TfoX/Sxy family protein [Celeribacter sp. PS-C1]
MAITAEDIAYIYDLFGPLGGLTHRKMMGGLSIYFDGQIFAILSTDGRVYLKAGGDFAKDLAAEGSVKFEMENGRGMNYWTLPEAALDDPQEACAWARRALDAL